MFRLIERKILVFLLAFSLLANFSFAQPAGSKKITVPETGLSFTMPSATVNEQVKDDERSWQCWAPGRECDYQVIVSNSPSVNTDMVETFAAKMKTGAVAKGLKVVDLNNTQPEHIHEYIARFSITNNKSCNYVYIFGRQGYFFQIYITYDDITKRSAALTESNNAFLSSFLVIEKISPYSRAMMDMYDQVIAIQNKEGLDFVSKYKYVLDNYKQTRSLDPYFVGAAGNLFSGRLNELAAKINLLDAKNEEAAFKTSMLEYCAAINKETDKIYKALQDLNLKGKANQDVLEDAINTANESMAKMQRLAKLKVDAPPPPVVTPIAEKKPVPVAGKVAAAKQPKPAPAKAKPVKVPPFKVEKGFIEVTQTDISKLAEFDFKKISFYGIRPGMTRKEFFDNEKYLPASFHMPITAGVNRANPDKTDYMAIRIYLVENNDSTQMLNLEWPQGEQGLGTFNMDNCCRKFFLGDSKQLFTEEVITNPVKVAKFFTTEPVVSTEYSYTYHTYPDQHLRIMSYGLLSGTVVDLKILPK